MTVFVKPVGDPYGNIGWAELETITTEGTALSDEGIPQRWDIITAPSSFTRTTMKRKLRLLT